MTNEQIAQRIREHANELAKNGHNLYRVRAFRQAALAVLGLSEEVSEMLNTLGRSALEAVPGIGESLAETVATFAQFGIWSPRTEAKKRVRYGLKELGSQNNSPAGGQV